MLRAGGPPGESLSARSSRCVFVGNIPYDASEESLIEIFQEVGPVVSFRLVFDKEKGKPKGYGFCEYRDAETAQSAIRNLNNVELNGRPLRVDFAENEKGLVGEAVGRGAANTREIAKQPPGGLPGVGGVGGVGTGAPQRPPTQQENIAAQMEGMTPNQLYDILWKMRLLIQQNADQARRILAANPPLSYALLQALVILGAVDAASVQQLLQSTMPAQPPANQPPPPVNQPLVGAPMNVGPAGMPNMPMQGMPGMAPGMGAPGMAPPAMGGPGMQQGMPPGMAPAMAAGVPGMAPAGQPYGGFPPGVRPMGPGQQFGPQGGFTPQMGGQPMMPQMGGPAGGPRMPGGPMMGMMGGPPNQPMGGPGQPPMGMPQIPGQPPMMMDQGELIQQLLSLTPQKLQQLSPAERQQIQQLQMMFQVKPAQ